MKTREELLDRYENEPTASKFSKSDKVLHFTPKELKGVLSAPTRKQLDCPYCHKGKHVYICENTYLEITPGETRVCKKRVIDYEEWQIGAVKFDYCPMCGRKLGDE